MVRESLRVGPVRQSGAHLGREVLLRVVTLDLVHREDAFSGGLNQLR